MPNKAEVVAGEEVVGTGNDARLARMSEIADSADRERAEELANVNDDDTTEPFEAPPGGEAESGEETALAAVEEPPVVDTPQTFKIKVNGKDLELTTEQLIERAQKVESADAYLAEAARLKREMEQPLQQSADEVARQALEEELALARAIQMGSEEEAVAAIRKLRTPSGPSKDDLMREVDARLTFREAIQQFQSEYKDITSDPYLLRLAQESDAEMVRKGDSRPYLERYREIGDGLRGWVKKLAPAAEAGTTAEKQARKAQAAPVPKAANAKAPPPAEEEAEESASEVIAKMAASRGGPQWMNGLPKH